MAIYRNVRLLFLVGAGTLTAEPDCTSCHPKIAASYSTTGMGRAFSRARPDRVPKMESPFFHALSGTYFAVERRGDEFVHRRWSAAGEAEPETLRIDYVMGSGNHALTFLHRNSKGALVELPLGWYAEKGGYFAMNPGFDSAQPATRRKIDYDCMGCHNAAPAVPAGSQEPVFLGELPQGIGCRQCHGPGAAHAAAANAGRPLQAIRSAIVNPARLPLARRREVCLQCHMETTSARLPSIIRRFGRAPFSYLPGTPLADYALHFDHAPASGLGDKFEIVSAVYRLNQSACFQKSEAMTCTSCHDPHSRSVTCAGCHTPAKLASKVEHPAGTACADCHMPKRRTGDVVRVVMTDHLVRRQPVPGDWLAEKAERAPPEYQGEVIPYYPAQGMDPLYVAVAQVLHGANLTTGIAGLEAELARKRPKEPEFYIVLGNAWQQVRRPEKAAESFRTATQVAPRLGRAWRFLGIALQDAGRATEAAAALLQAIALDGGDAVAWHQLGLLDSAAGLTRNAVEKARRAIALDPDLLDAHSSLGAGLAALGDRAGAERAFRDALRVDPFFATAHGNLARLLAANGDNAAALTHFARAVQLRRDFAPDRHEYALSLVRANRFAEARTEVDAALRLSPRVVAARILSGGLFARDGKLAEATAEYRVALQVQPGSGRAHLDLARVLIRLGDRDGTVRHLRLATAGDDAASAELARQALRNLGATP
ncbi:MAG: tetratricopeptide repeat protein [Bryobacterales bacterium]|nr:tetratricopeptide repeat protein [Bryobacterales bacterium]